MHCVHTITTGVAFDLLTFTTVNKPLSSLVCIKFLFSRAYWSTFRIDKIKNKPKIKTAHRGNRKKGKTMLEATQQKPLIRWRSVNGFCTYHAYHVVFHLDRMCVYVLKPTQAWYHCNAKKTLYFDVSNVHIAKHIIFNTLKIRHVWYDDSRIHCPMYYSSMKVDTGYVNEYISNATKS